MRPSSETELRQSLADIATPQILVVGDLMLDRYSWGKVHRISPEAPIPVLQVAQDDQRLGGAGNVMMNLSALGAKVLACGVTGKDEAGEIVLGLLQEQEIDTSGVSQHQDYTTVLKHRMIAGHTHLLRMDVDPPPESEVPQEELIDYLKKTVPKVTRYWFQITEKAYWETRCFKTLRQWAKHTIFRCSVTHAETPTMRSTRISP